MPRMTDGNAMTRVVRGTVAGLWRFEGLLALVLALFPLLLIQFDVVRDNISAYHAMDDPKWFYVPLVWTVVMLIVNGLVRSDRHGYNAVLGVLLLGVVMFDHAGGSRIIHGISAVAFYALSLIFIALQVTDYLHRQSHHWSISRQRVVAAVLLLLQVLLLLVLYLTASLFWAEAVGLWLIAAHYLWHSGRHARNLASDEPTQVFERLFEPCYRLIVVLLKPVDLVWKSINRS